jgi:excisionase family DNA binding protein
MDTHRLPTTGQHNGPGTGSHVEIGRLLAHLEQRLAELDRLHRVIAEDAQALAHAAAATPEDRDATGAPSVYSIPDAAAELGVSVSMLHKLLKQHRLGHLKDGARTLITAEHLEQFRDSSEVPAPEAPQRRPRAGRRGTHRLTRGARRHAGGRPGGLGGCVVSRGENTGRTTNGRSSIHKGADGRWHGYVSMGRTDAGKPVRRHVRGRTRTEVTQPSTKAKPATSQSLPRLPRGCPKRLVLRDRHRPSSPLLMGSPATEQVLLL